MRWYFWIQLVTVVGLTVAALVVLAGGNVPFGVILLLAALVGVFKLRRAPRSGDGWFRACHNGR